MSKRICSPLADLMNKPVIQIKMRNESCEGENTHLKALVILHPDTLVRGDAVMSHSCCYHHNSTKQIMRLRKWQTKCPKDSSDICRIPLQLNLKSL